MDTTLPTSHGGILFPLEVFRVSHLAAALAEVLISKARNIVDAKLLLTRHPTTQLVLARIEGGVVGEDPAEFWRENADLALVASQVLPRQCFMYFSARTPDRREGFLVAQRGQVLAADDAAPDNMPADAPEEEWPLQRLLGQIRVSPSELASGFAGGPTVETSLMDPSPSEDQRLLLILAGQDPDADPDADQETDAGAAGATASSADAGTSAASAAAAGHHGMGAEAASSTATPAASAPAAAKPAAPRRMTAEEDAKRRAAEQAAEQAELERQAEAARSGLVYEVDERGCIVWVPTELSEVEILSPFLVDVVRGEIPTGLPRALETGLQGKRIDFVVAVDFLSEVFLNNAPLAKPTFEAESVAVDVAGLAAQRLEVFAPRLGSGTLYRVNGKNAFVSRTPELAQPLPLLRRVLERP